MADQLWEESEYFVYDRRSTAWQVGVHYIAVIYVVQINYEMYFKKLQLVFPVVK